MRLISIITAAALLAVTAVQAAPMNLSCSYRLEPPDDEAHALNVSGPRAVLDLDRRIFIPPIGRGDALSVLPVTEVTETTVRRQVFQPVPQGTTQQQKLCDGPD
jgi:hypothetical protein